MIRGFGLSQDIDGQEWQEVVFADTKEQASQKLQNNTPCGYSLVYESFSIVDEPSETDNILMLLNERDRQN